MILLERILLETVLFERILLERILFERMREGRHQLAGTKPRASHHRSSGGERRGKRKR